MKRLLVIIGILSLLLTGNSLAGKEKPKGNEKQQGPAPSESAYEHASDNAKFKRPADGLSVKHQSKDADEQQDRKEKGDKKAEQERHREQVENQNRNDDNGAVDSGEEGKNNKMKKTKFKRWSSLFITVLMVATLAMMMAPATALRARCIMRPKVARETPMHRPASSCDKPCRSESRIASRSSTVNRTSSRSSKGMPRGLK